MNQVAAGKMTLEDLFRYQMTSRRASAIPSREVGILLPRDLASMASLWIGGSDGIYSYDLVKHDVSPQKQWGLCTGMVSFPRTGALFIASSDTTRSGLLAYDLSTESFSPLLGLRHLARPGENPNPAAHGIGLLDGLGVEWWVGLNDGAAIFRRPG